MEIHFLKVQTKEPLIWGALWATRKCWPSLMTNLLWCLEQMAEVTLQRQDFVVSRGNWEGQFGCSLHCTVQSCRNSGWKLSFRLLGPMVKWRCLHKGVACLGVFIGQSLMSMECKSECLRIRNSAVTREVPTRTGTSRAHREGRGQPCRRLEAVSLGSVTSWI